MTSSGNEHSDIENYSLYLTWKTLQLERQYLTQPLLEQLLQMIQLGSNPSLVSIPPRYNEVLQRLAPDRSQLRYGLWSDLQTTEGEPDLYE
jgi:hypothetical protein